MSLIGGDFMEISHGHCLYDLFGNHCVVKHFNKSFSSISSESEQQLALYNNLRSRDQSKSVLEEARARRQVHPLHLSNWYNKYQTNLKWFCFILVPGGAKEAVGEGGVALFRLPF